MAQKFDNMHSSEEIINKIKDFFKHSICKGVRFDTSVKIDIVDDGNIVQAILSHIFYNEETDEISILVKKESSNFAYTAKVSWSDIKNPEVIYYLIS